MQSSVYTVEDRAWTIAVQRSDVLRPLAEKQRLSLCEVNEAARLLQISIPHVYRLIRKLRAEQTTSAMTLQSPGPRKGRRRLPPHIEQIIDQAIDRLFMKREKLTLKRFYGLFVLDCRARGHVPPCFNTVRSRIKARDLKTTVRRRSGKVCAEATFHQIQGSLEADRPLEIVQIDHTKVDLMLVDDITRASIGRPWLTLVMDIHTRMVLGFLLSLEAPSTTSVALALTQAVLPKDSWRAERLIENSWPTSGIPRCIHVDNGAEFHGRSFERGCEQHGIQIAYRPPATPRYGGHIERLMRTLMHRIQALPGTTFSNVVERGDYRSEERACLSFREFERILALEVLGPYHNEIHRGLGQPPIAKWTSSIETAVSRQPLDS